MCRSDVRVYRAVFDFVVKLSGEKTVSHNACTMPCPTSSWVLQHWFEQKRYWQCTSTLIGSYAEQLSSVNDVIFTHYFFLEARGLYFAKRRCQWGISTAYLVLQVLRLSSLCIGGSKSVTRVKNDASEDSFCNSVCQKCVPGCR